MFDEEEAGAIDTEDGGESWSPPAYPAGGDPMQGMGGGDNSGQPAIPVPGEGADNSGQPAVPAPNMGGQGAEQGGRMNPILAAGKEAIQHPLEAMKKYPGNFKSIISYLTGSDAMPPEAIDGAGRTVDPRGEMNPSQRNLLAIQHARENGGDEAAWALMQSNRVAYNAQTSFGKAALQGTAQKPPDLMAAIDAANKAQANVLDGTNVEFRPLQGGKAVTATVTGPDGQPQQIVLSPQAFSKWLDVGGDGQWDKIMSTSAVATLQKLAGEGPSRGATSLAQAAPVPNAREREPLQPPSAPVTEADGAPAPKRKTTYGTAAAPSTMNLSGSDEAGTEQPDLTNYDPQLEARAFQMFPGVGDTQQRAQFMVGQEQQDADRENKIGVAAEKGKNDREKASIAGNAKVQSAGIYADASKFKASQMGEAQKNKVMMELQRQERIAASTASRNAASLLRQKLANNLFDKMSPEENEQVKSMIGAGQPGAAPSHAPAPTQAAPQGQASPQRAQLGDGKYYIRGPDGKAKLDPNQNP